MVHLKLASDPVYVAACAEDTYLSDLSALDRIQDRLRRGGGKAQLYMPTIGLNSSELMSAIGPQINAVADFASAFLADDIADSAQEIARMRSRCERLRRDTEIEPRNWDDREDLYVRSVFSRAQVVAVFATGAVVRLPGRFKGWIPKSRIPDSRLAALTKGNVIEVRVLGINPSRKSIVLEYVRP
jgi:hypothetical protein